jgi:hypothetical protein
MAKDVIMREMDAVATPHRSPGNGAARILCSRTTKRGPDMAPRKRLG